MILFPFLYDFWAEFPTTQTHKNKQNASEGYQKSENPSLAFTFEKWSQKVTKSLPIALPKWSKWRPKNILNPCQKYDRKIKQKILISSSQMGELFGVFGIKNQPLQALGAQLGAKSWIFQKYGFSSPKNGQRTTKTSTTRALWHQISHHYNGLAVCAKRLNN